MIERLYRFEKREEGGWVEFTTVSTKAGLSEALKRSRLMNVSGIQTRVRSYVLSSEQENP